MMNKIKSLALWIVAILLLLVSSYQTYALIDVSAQLAESGVSLGRSSSNYSFASPTAGSAVELPDMAGGC